MTSDSRRQASALALHPLDDRISMSGNNSFDIDILI